MCIYIYTYIYIIYIYVYIYTYIYIFIIYIYYKYIYIYITYYIYICTYRDTCVVVGHSQSLHLFLRCFYPCFFHPGFLLRTPQDSTWPLFLMAPCPWVQAAMWHHLIRWVPCWNGGAVWKPKLRDQCMYMQSWFNAHHEASWIMNVFMHTYISYDTYRDHMYEFGVKIPIWFQHEHWWKTCFDTT